MVNTTSKNEEPNRRQPTHLISPENPIDVETQSNVCFSRSGILLIFKLSGSD